jgi:hypothetical protein
MYDYLFIYLFICVLMLATLLRHHHTRDRFQILDAQNRVTLRFTKRTKQKVYLRAMQAKE